MFRHIASKDARHNLNNVAGFVWSFPFIWLIHFEKYFVTASVGNMEWILLDCPKGRVHGFKKMFWWVRERGMLKNQIQRIHTTLFTPFQKSQWIYVVYFQNSVLIFDSFSWSSKHLLDCLQRHIQSSRICSSDLYQLRVTHFTSPLWCRG